MPTHDRTVRTTKQVDNALQGAGEEVQPYSGGVELFGQTDDFGDRAAEAVELPDDQGVAGVEAVQGGSKAGAVVAAGADRLDEQPSAPVGHQGVELQAGVLVGGRDPGIGEATGVPVRIDDLLEAVVHPSSLCENLSKP
jgi:hypothetical protein